jgi:hypothetical protein
MRRPFFFTPSAPKNPNLRKRRVLFNTLIGAFFIFQLLLTRIYPMGESQSFALVCYVLMSSGNFYGHNALIVSALQPIAFVM